MPIYFDTKITGATVIRTGTDDLLGTPGRTLDAMFAAARKLVGVLHNDTERHSEMFGRARRGLRIDWELDDGTLVADDGLTYGELYALWLNTKLDEIDAEWGAAVDASLAEWRATEGKPFDPEQHAVWSKRSTAIDIRAGVRRAMAVKKAYGVTYNEWTAK